MTPVQQIPPQNHLSLILLLAPFPPFPFPSPLTSFCRVYYSTTYVLKEHAEGAVGPASQYLTSHGAFEPSHRVFTHDPLMLQNNNEKSVTLETFQFDRSWLKAVAFQNMPNMLVTLETFQLEMSWLKEEARLNMFYMVVTLEAFQLEMSWLKVVAP
jgi:hypothetical protein